MRGTKNTLFGCKNKAAYHPKITVPVVKHSGGSIMLLDCLSLAGTGALSKIMASAKYKSVLEQKLLASIRQLKMNKKLHPSAW